MSLLRYPKYKDSGVEWLGEVPEHWEIKQVRHLVNDGNDGMKIGPFGSQLTSEALDEAGEFKVYGQENVIATDFQRGSRFISKAKFSELSVYEIRPGDILVTMMGTSGRCAKVPEELTPGIMDSHLLRLRVRAIVLPEFLRLLIDEAAYVEAQINLLGKGSIMQGLNSGIVKELMIALPSIQEQEALLRSIGRETFKIDALVEEQRRLIELLKEKRQAVISHAVTKGLNPDAPMKDSGIEWLGQVPGHWKVGKCGFYLTILSGFAFPSSGFTEDENDTKLLRGINVGVFGLKWEETAYWHRTPGDRFDAYEMRTGDIVIGMDRPVISGGVRVAKVKESDLPCLLLQRVASLKTMQQLNADYLLGLLSSEMFAAHFSPETTGVSVPHISPEQIYNFMIPVPPASEQAAIVHYVAFENEKLDTLTLEATRAIDLLQERRTALISAAVTGKIDVRGLSGTEAA
jgi:type I restriction enzyme S subunit